MFLKELIWHLAKSAEDKVIIETMRPCRGILVTQVSNENDLGHGSCWSGDENGWIYLDRCDFPVYFPGSMVN